jgi:hypothetical protein
VAAYRGDKKLGKSSDSANEGVRFTRMESMSLCRHLMSVHTRGYILQCRSRDGDHITPVGQ